MARELPYVQDVTQLKVLGAVTDSQTTITVDDGSPLGPNYPLSAGAWNETLYPSASAAKRDGAWEAVSITSRAVDDLTVVRGYSGTTPIAWTGGVWVLDVTIVAQDWDAADTALQNALASNPGSQFINVTSSPYNATGDGVTDDTAAIQAAFDAVDSAEGGIVYFPRGVYRVDATADPPVGETTFGGVKPKSNTTILLAGELYALDAGSAGAYAVLHLSEVERVTLIGGVIRGDRDIHSGGTGEQGFGLFVRGSTDIVILHTEFLKCWGDGLYISSNSGNDKRSERVAFAGIKCHDNRRGGATVVNASHVSGHGSFFFSNTGTNPQHGFEVEPDGGEFATDVHLTDCHAADNAGKGFRFEGTNGPVLRASLKGCSSVRSGSFGIELHSCEECTVSDCHAVDGETFGVYLNDCKRCVVRGGSARGNKIDAGVVVSAGAEDNRIVELVAESNDRHGIQIAGKGTALVGVVASDNSKETHNTFNGIQIVSGSEGTILTACRTHKGDASPQQRFGVAIIAGALKVLAQGNDFRDGGAQANISEGAPSETTLLNNFGDDL